MVSRLGLLHRIKTHRRSTQLKKRNGCHAMIRHQNAAIAVLPMFAIAVLLFENNLRTGAMVRHVNESLF